MPRFTVFLYPITFVKIPNVEAMSPTEAITKAEESLNKAHSLDHLLNQTFSSGCPATNSEYAEEIHSFLVDELDDKGERIPEKSQDFCSDGQTPFNSAREALLRVLRHHASLGPEQKAEAEQAAAYAGLGGPLNS
jgi:hypothetical protein